MCSVSLRTAVQGLQLLQSQSVSCLIWIFSVCSVSLLTAVVGLQLLQSQQDKKAKGGVVVTSDTDEVDILPNSQLVAVCAILVGKQPGSHIHFFTFILIS